MAHGWRAVWILALVSLVVATVPALVLAQNPAVTVSVNVAANRRAINPNVYGVAHAGTTALSDLNVPLNRNGGN
jgi:hypothetical protein